MTQATMMETKMRFAQITPIALALLLGATVPGFAQQQFQQPQQQQPQEYRGDDAEEVEALNQAQISLADAIAMAEQETTGQALEATLEVEDGRTFYEVEVFAENTVQHVYVDAGNGSMLDVQQDWDD